MKERFLIAVVTGLIASTPAAAAGRDLAACAATVAGLCIDTTVNLSLLAPILIFASGFMINEWLKAREIAAERFKLYKALLVEIRLNLKGLKEADHRMPSSAAFSQFLRADKNNRPVLVYHFTADVYEANIGNLPGLPSSLIEGLVTFYQTLAFIRCAAASVDLPAFTTISDEGRESLIEMIRDKIRIAHAQGEGAERQLDQILDGHTKISGNSTKKFAR